MVKAGVSKIPAGDGSEIHAEPLEDELRQRWNPTRADCLGRLGNLLPKTLPKQKSTD